MTRFDYSKLDAVYLAVDYALEHDRCPECLHNGLNMTESVKRDYADVEITCPACKLRLFFGCPLDDSPVADFIREGYVK